MGSIFFETENSAIFKDIVKQAVVNFNADTKQQTVEDFVSKQVLRIFFVTLEINGGFLEASPVAHKVISIKILSDFFMHVPP